MQNWVWGLLGLTLERLLGGPDCFSQSIQQKCIRFYFSEACLVLLALGRNKAVQHTEVCGRGGCSDSSIAPRVPSCFPGALDALWYV